MLRRSQIVRGIRRLDLLRGQLTVAEALVAADGQGLVWTTPKIHEARVVDLAATLCKELDAHLREFTEGGTGPDALVFTASGGLPQEQSRCTRHAFKPAVRAGPPRRQAPTTRQTSWATRTSGLRTTVRAVCIRR
jgi:hypothetical protein